MTSTPERTTPTTLSRRETRALMAQAGLAPSRPRRSAWTLKRAIASAGAGAAAIGFLAAYIVPTTTASAEPQESVASSYAASVADAQGFTAPAELATSNSLPVTDYEIYVTPTPTPEPKPAAAASSGGGGAVSMPFYVGGGSKEQWLTAAGIAPENWGYVDYIATRESGWNPNATNPSSGACGLIQALPCSKVPGNGYNPVDNLRWAQGYAIGRYGSWANAYAFWTANHWW